MRNKLGKRLLSGILCCAMLLGNLPALTFADQMGGLCEHHSVHTPECGYTEESPCTFVCTECGAAEIISATEAPTEVTEEATEAPTEEATEEATEAPTEAATEAVTEEATEAPTEEATEEATEEVTEEATEAPSEEATEEMTEPESLRIQVVFSCNPEELALFVFCAGTEESIAAEADGSYLLAAGDYGYIASLDGYETLSGTFTLTEETASPFEIVLNLIQTEQEPTEEPIDEPIFNTVEADEEEVTVWAAPEAALPDNEALFEAFVDRELFGYDLAPRGTQARSLLTPMEQEIYDVLKADIETVALNGGSTEFVLPEISGLKTTWTNEELGVSSIEDTTDIEAAFLSQFSLNAIVEALLQDCPFDLYWYDKVVGTKLSFGIGKSGYTDGVNNVWITATIRNVTFAMVVCEDCRGSQNYVSTNVSRVTTAKNNAAQLVAANAGKSPYERMTAYKNYICSAVTYDEDSAKDKTTPYGAPWQLISVFDGDSSTNVVCEGYSKAFQYLCDLSGLDCISVTGTLTGGDHMWNVVTLDGQRYLVDVTNSDSGTVGGKGGLFLVGAPYQNGGYTFSCPGGTANFRCDDLNLAETNYTEKPPVTTYSVMVSATGNGTVTANPAIAPEGTEITLTVTPDSGNVLKELSVTWGVGSTVTVTENKFTMPAGDVTVSAVFEEVLGSGSCGSDLSWVLRKNGVLTISGYGDMWEWDHWSDDNSPWYSDRKAITSVVIEEGVSNVGSCAFLDCSNLTSITLPDSLTSIGDSAIRLCTSLSSITIPDGVTSIGAAAFHRCSSLSAITIPYGVTSIGGSAFNECSSLESVVLPDSVTYIEWSTFYRCSSLNSITLPDGITSIEYLAFSGCSSLSAITIPDTVASIGNAAFSDCTSLSEVYFGGDAPKISNNCFDGTVLTAYYPGENKTWTSEVMQNYGGKLTWVPYSSGTCGENLTWTLVDGVLTISGTGAMSYYYYDTTPWYRNRSEITSVVLPDGLTSICMGAFYGCTGLTSVTIPEGVTAIESQTFSGCSSLTNVTLPEGLASIGGYAFNMCSSLSSITLPASVTDIGVSAFAFCSSLSSITIPAGVTSLSGNVFLGCTKLTSITIPEGVTVIGSFAFCGSSLTSITIPKGVSSIENNCFEGCKKLTSVTFEGSAPSIGSTAFSGVTATAYYPGDDTSWTADKLVNYRGTLTWVPYFSGTCGENLTWTLVDGVLTISGTGAMGDSSSDNPPWYKYWDKITSVVIQEGVTSIKSFAFSYCTKMASITIPEGVTSVGYCAFNHCSSLTGITIPVGVTYIGNNCFEGCKKLTSVIFEGSAPSIGSTAFSGVTATAYYPGDDTSWTADKLVNYGGTLTWVPYFRGTCGENLTWMLADGVLTISGTGDMTDYDIWNDSHAPWHEKWESITTVVLWEGVTSVGDYAFDNCSYLSSVTLPEGVTSIGEGAFFWCGSLSSISIPESVTSIGKLALSGCTGLRSINIPEGVTSIGTSAFYWCSSLTSITIPEGVTSIGAGTFCECSSLRTITIPKGVNFIGKEAFLGCCSLSSITIPENVTSIEELTFCGCSSLTSITIPEDVTSIGKGAFSSCNKLTSVTFEGSAPSIDDSAFSGVTATAQYPGNDTSWTADKLVNYGGNLTWVPYGGHEHAYNAVVTPPTCTEQGFTTYTCDCGDSYVADFVDALGHKEVIDPVAEPTYTKPGLTEGSHCSVCGEVLIPQKEIPVKELEAPAGLTARMSASNTVILNWSPVEAAEGYDIYRQTDGGKFYFIKSVTGNEAYNYNLTLGKTYGFKIAAYVVEDGVKVLSGYSEVQEVTILKAGTPLLKSVVQSAAKTALVKWTTVGGVDGYELYRGRSESGPFYLMKSLSENVTSNYNLTEGVTYYYKVRAYVEDSSGTREYGEFSNSIPVTIRDIAAVQMKSAAQNGNTTAMLKWSSVKNANGYELWCATGKNTEFQLLRDFNKTGTAMQVSKLESGETYHFKMRAYQNTQEGKLYGNFSEVISLTILATPVLEKAEQDGAGCVRLVWNSIDGAEGYRVVVSTSNGILKEVDVPDASTTIQELETGTTYTFKVCAYTSNGMGKSYGQYSAAKSVEVKIAPTVTKLAQNGPFSVNIYWDDIGTEQYELYRATEADGVFTRVKSVTGTETRNYSLTEGGTYYYKLRGFDIVNGKRVYTAFSSVAKIALLKTPVITGAVRKSNSCQLTWDAIEGAEGYRLYRSTSESGGFTLVKTITGTSTTTYSLDAETTYYFRVKAIKKVDGATQDSGYSNIMEAPAP